MVSKIGKRWFLDEILWKKNVKVYFSARQFERLKEEKGWLKLLSGTNGRPVVIDRLRW